MPMQENGSKMPRKLTAKVTIINETKYSSRNLRTFFLAGMKAMGIKESKRIRVAYSHASKHWGQAQLGKFAPKATGGVRRYEGYRVLMTLPGDPTKLDLREFSRVFEHELLHNLGVEHKDMTPVQLYCTGPLPAWAEGLSIAMTTPRAKPSMEDRITARETKAVAMLDIHARKLARQEKLVTKWKRKVTYYAKQRETKMAAKPAHFIDDKLKNTP